MLKRKRKCCQPEAENVLLSMVQLLDSFSWASEQGFGTEIDLDILADFLHQTEGECHCFFFWTSHWLPVPLISFVAVQSRGSLSQVGKLCFVLVLVLPRH